MNSIRDYVEFVSGISDSVVLDVVSGMICFLFITLVLGCFAWFLNRVFSI